MSRMPRVFLLLSAGGPTGAITQARLALAGVAHESATTGVGHACDFAQLFALRDRLRAARPEVLHAVGPAAARAAALLKLPRVGLRPFPRLVVSGCDAPDGWLTRRATARADAVLAYSPGEEARYRAFVSTCTTASRVHARFGDFGGGGASGSARNRRTISMFT